MALLLGLCLFGAQPAAAQDNSDQRPAAGIQDNSFLIEEAYNQGAGVVQHIVNLRRQGRDWNYTFTQEWPVGSETHQLSYTLPYSWLREGQHAQGFGDVMLNYRYQMLTESATMPAFAPRFSVILPSGSRRQGLGDGSAGFQIGLPFSKIVSDRVTLHANAGMTHLFDVAGFSPTSYSLGGSAIYAVTRDFNLMLETLGEWDQSVNEARRLERQAAFTLSPGMRYAFNLDAGQLVVGFAAPIVLSNDAPSYGAFLYLSFEHSFLAKK
jgi:hypothetical protein